MYHGDNKGKDERKTSVSFGKECHGRAAHAEQQRRAAHNFHERGNSRGSASGTNRDSQGRQTSSGPVGSRNPLCTNRRSDESERRTMSAIGRPIGWGRDNPPSMEDDTAARRNEDERRRIEDRQRMEYLRAVDTAVVQNANGNMQSCGRNNGIPQGTTTVHTHGKEEPTGTLHKYQR